MAALWDFGVRDPKEAGGDSGEDDDEEGEDGEDGGNEEFTLDEVLRLGGTKVRGGCGGREREHVAAESPRDGPVGWGWRGRRWEQLRARGLARDPL